MLEACPVPLQNMVMVMIVVIKVLAKKTFAKDGDGGVGKCGKQVRGGG